MSEEREQLQRIAQLIHAVPYWNHTAQLRAMTTVLLNRYDHCSDAERAAEIQRIRSVVEELLKTDPLTLAHQALVAAEQRLERATFSSGDPGARRLS